MVEAVAPEPVNVLVGGPSDLTVPALAALGVRRVSVGSALAVAAWGGFLRVPGQIADHGRFDGFEGAAPRSQLNDFVRASVGGG